MMCYFTQFCTNYYSFLLLPCLSKSLHTGDSVKDKCTYFVKVAVAPHLPVHERTRQDASLGVKFGPLAHAPPLQPNKLSCGRIRHIDHCQAAAGQPHSWPALSVVHDAQRELSVIVINLLCARVAVEVNREEIASMSLKRRKNGEVNLRKCL